MYSAQVVRAKSESAEDNHGGCGGGGRRSRKIAKSRTSNPQSSNPQNPWVLIRGSQVIRCKAVLSVRP
eukprot:15473233-Alexandrium_andersonii.AAC.1